MAADVNFRLILFYPHYLKAIKTNLLKRHFLAEEVPFYFAFDKLPISLYIYPVVGKKDMGKSSFKASE